MLADPAMLDTLMAAALDEARAALDRPATTTVGRAFEWTERSKDRHFDGPTEGFNSTRFGRTLFARNLFDTFAQRFTRAGDRRITADPTGALRELTEDFRVTDAMIVEFKEHVQKSRLRIDEAAWIQDQPFIRAMIRFEIDVDLFGVAIARKNLSMQDPQLQHALTLFPEAAALMRLSAAPGRQAQR
jgi:hypothetical protein